MSDDNRPFPVQATHDKPSSTIPWWLAEIVYEYYRQAFPSSAADHSLEKIAIRGGFARSEIVSLIRGVWSRR